MPLVDTENLKDLIYKYISHIKVDLIKKSIDVEYKKKVKKVENSSSEKCN